MIHVDIMDGHFVPNFTMGPPIPNLCAGSRLKLDHHLMIEDPDTMRLSLSKREQTRSACIMRRAAISIGLFT